MIFGFSFLAESSSLGSLWTYLSRRDLQSSHPEQVVRRAHHVGGELRLHPSDEAALSESADRFHPAEDLLDSFALLLTERITVMPRGARIQARSAAALDPSAVGRDAASSEHRDEGLGVIALVGAERAHVPASFAPAIDKGHCRLGFSKRCVGDGQIDQKTVAVFHERMRPEGELRGLPV